MVKFGMRRPGVDGEGFPDPDVVDG